MTRLRSFSSLASAALGALVLLQYGCAVAPLSMEKGVVSPTQDIVLRSPGRTLSVSVGVSGSGRLSYAIMEDGAPVLAPSPLGLKVDGVDLGQGAKITGSPRVREIDEVYNLLGNHAAARNHAMEAVIPVETAGKKFDLIVRAYDDGAAVRYTLPEGARRIDGDGTGWNLPQNTSKVVWMDQSQCYEGLSHATTLAQVPEGKPVMGPITVQMPGHYLAISDADCETFSDLAFVRQGQLLTAHFPFNPDRKSTRLNSSH